MNNLGAEEWIEVLLFFNESKVVFWKNDHISSTFKLGIIILAINELEDKIIKFGNEQEVFCQTQLFEVVKWSKKVIQDENGRKNKQLRQW